MKSQIQHKDVYPKYEEMAEADIISARLTEHILTVSIHKCRIKIENSFNRQAIMQATRPRAILSPLQLGLGVQLHHHFASKFLIETLHKHGFSCSYKVIKFERSAAVGSGIEVADPTPDTFIQYVSTMWITT